MVKGKFCKRIQRVDLIDKTKPRFLHIFHHCIFPSPVTATYSSINDHWELHRMKIAICIPLSLYFTFNALLSYQCINIFRGNLSRRRQSLLCERENYTKAFFVSTLFTFPTWLIAKQLKTLYILRKTYGSRISHTSIFSA